MAESIVVAAITTVPPTVAALAAWINARHAKNQTNGVMTERFDRIDGRLTRLEERQVRVEERVTDLASKP